MRQGFYSPIDVILSTFSADTPYLIIELLDTVLSRFEIVAPRFKGSVVWIDSSDLLIFMSNSVTYNLSFSFKFKIWIPFLSDLLDKELEFIILELIV